MRREEKVKKGKEKRRIREAKGVEEREGKGREEKGRKERRGEGEERRGGGE
jgi:hypothetical protein